MPGERRSLSKQMGDNTASVTVQLIGDSWLIQEVHWDGESVGRIRKTSFHTADEAIAAGMEIAVAMCNNATPAHAKTSNSVA